MENSQNDSDISDVDFRGLILGLSGAALHYLGETTPSPKNGEGVSLPLARQNIEIIALLSEKTKGNLTNEEEGLIQQVLLDLRMRFIEKSKHQK